MKITILNGNSSWKISRKKGKDSVHSASSLFHFMPDAKYLTSALRAQSTLLTLLQ